MKDPVFKEEIISGSKAKKGLFHDMFFLTIVNSAKNQNPTTKPKTQRSLSQLKWFSEGSQHFRGELAVGHILSIVQFIPSKNYSKNILQ